MNTIDERILIPTHAEVVWSYISDLTKNVEWQPHYRNVTLLTNQKGPGTRWRYQTADGRECVGEITAWYDGIGYEYRIVDGMPYRHNQGRIRLHETPDGTVVQWTFNYEVGGMLGGLRNAMSVRRSEEQAIVESLSALWKQVSRVVSRDQPFVAKSLMQEAPDVEVRAQYSPRHPSSVEPQDSAEFGKLELEEPPIEEDDTRPRPAVQEAEFLPTTNEPDFLDDIEEDETAPYEELQFARPYPSSQEDITQPSRETFIPPEEAKHDIDEGGTDELLVQQKDQIQSPSEATAEPQASPSDQVVEQNTDAGTEKSIFEIFGVQKPSETQEAEFVEIEEEIDEADASNVERTDTSLSIDRIVESPSPAQPTRVGRRVLLRRQRINIRRP